MASRPRYRWQISLRLLLGLFLVAGLGLGWVGRNLREHRLEQQWVAELQASQPFNPPLAAPPPRDNLIPMLPL